MYKLICRATRIAGVAVFLLASLCTGAQASPFSSLIVYGDSLSDNGNLYAAVGLPDAPYYLGRRSNGPVAVEQLAVLLGVPLIDFAWIGATTGIGNYADGGTPSSFGANSLPGMQIQFAATQALLTPYLTDGLFVVWGGPNDFLSPSPIDSTPEEVIQRAVQDLLGLVTSLEALGAHHILVPGMPDLGLTPYYQSLGSVPAAQGSAITDALNAALSASLPADVYFYDTAGLLRSMVANPGAYGFTNVTDPCFNTISVCANPEQYLFFDDFHPTMATASYVARGFLTATVPEPPALVFMLVGFILYGFARKRVV